MNTVRKHERALREFEMQCREAGNPGILAPVHLEICRTERLRLEDAIALARSHGSGKPVAVVHRTNRTEWKITMTLADFFNLSGQMQRSEGRALEELPAP